MLWWIHNHILLYLNMFMDFYTDEFPLVYSWAHESSSCSHNFIKCLFWVRYHAKIFDFIQLSPQESLVRQISLLPSSPEKPTEAGVWLKTLFRVAQLSNVQPQDLNPSTDYELLVVRSGAMSTQEAGISCLVSPWHESERERTLELSCRDLFLGSWFMR